MSERTDDAATLPLELETLEFVFPAEKKDQYVRTPSGTYRREYVNADDQASIVAFWHQISAGTLKVLPVGWTSATMKANADAQASGNAAYEAVLQRLTDEAAAADRAEMESRLAKVRARLEAEYAQRNVAGFKRGY